MRASQALALSSKELVGLKHIQQVLVFQKTFEDDFKYAHSMTRDLT